MSTWPTPQPIETAPIPMILFCAKCRTTHIDRGEWASRPHRTHLCEHCGFKWRPANVPTVGVLVLPPAPGKEGS